jgi:putative ABC transport system ATP-binding protein
MGPSGSGKIHTAELSSACWTGPIAGVYELDDKADHRFAGNGTSSQIRREKIGFVYSSRSTLIPRLTAAENIELPLVLSGMPSAGTAAASV